MTNQQILESCILKLVNEFLERPFNFINERNAVTRFYQLLIEEEPALASKVQTQDGGYRLKAGQGGSFGKAERMSKMASI